MARVKRGKIANKRRKSVLKETKGYRWGRKSKYRLAKTARYHALAHSYRSRKEKKRNARALWEVKINAACRELELSYNKLIAGLKKNNIELNRKTLAELAQNYPQLFKQVAEKTK